MEARHGLITVMRGAAAGRINRLSESGPRSEELI